MCEYTANRLKRQISHVIINLLLDLSNLINVLDSNFIIDHITRIDTAFLFANGLFDKPSGLRGSYFELIGPIMVGPHFHPQRYISPVHHCLGIEFLFIVLVISLLVIYIRNVFIYFTELHHIYTQRTQGLTHLGIRFGHACQHSQHNSGFVRFSRNLHLIIDTFILI